jgi:hypothetical protein
MFQLTVYVRSAGGGEATELNLERIMVIARFYGCKKPFRKVEVKKE